MSDLSDTDLVRMEQAWHNKFRRLIYAGGLACGLLLLVPLILAIRVQPSLSTLDILLLAVLGAAFFGIPFALWIETLRRRRPDMVFGRRTALLQIDQMQRRAASILTTTLVISLINATLQEISAVALSARPHASAARDWPYWFVIALTTSGSTLTAWRLMKPEYAAGLIHPHAALAMSDEWVQAARGMALGRAYRMLSIVIALACATVLVRPHSGAYLMPLVLCAAVALPAALLRAALKDETGCAGNAS